LPSNRSFVEAYNKLIREFQTSTIKLCQTHLQQALDQEVCPKLENLKTEINSLSSNGDSIISEIVTSVNTNFISYAIRKEHKYSRIVLKEYKVNNRLDSSFSNLSDLLDGANFNRPNNNNNHNSLVHDRSKRNNYNNRNFNNHNRKYNRSNSSYNNRSNNSNNRSRNNGNRSVQFDSCLPSSTANNRYSSSGSRNFRRDIYQTTRR